MVSFAKKWIWF